MVAVLAVVLVTGLAVVLEVLYNSEARPGTCVLREFRRLVSPCFAASTASNNALRLAMSVALCDTVCK